MEAWVPVIFGGMAGWAIARLHALFDGGALLAIPLGVLGGLAGGALLTDYWAGLLDNNSLAGTTVAAVVGGAIAGALSGPLRTYLFPRIAHRIAGSRAASSTAGDAPGA